MQHVSARVPSTHVRLHDALLAQRVELVAEIKLLDAAHEPKGNTKSHSHTAKSSQCTSSASSIA